MTIATAQTPSVAHLAEDYYNSNDADRFYFHVWGGEDIHIGIFDDPAGASPPIREASSRTIARMAAMLDGLAPDTRVLDIGAGYGGAARWLARHHGCAVTCLNLSTVQNARNRELCADQKLNGFVKVMHGNFEALPFRDESFDLVWCQDAILHSGRRDRVMEEVARVLGPGGSFIFTDPMQADDCPEGVLQPVLDRIHLPSLGSVAFYRDQAARLGLKEVAYHPLTLHLVAHYRAVADELRARRDELARVVNTDYLERMLTGLGHWVDAGEADHMAWGILHFRKPRAANA